MLHLIKGTGKRISTDFHHSGRLVVDFIHYSNSKFTTKLIWDLGFHEEYKGNALKKYFSRQCTCSSEGKNPSDRSFMKALVAFSP